MNELKANLIEQALRSYEFIFPCAGKKNLDECFMIDGGRLLFWFNTPDRSTHLLVESLA